MTKQDQIDALLDAAYGVLEHWEHGDLAAHVRHLQDTVRHIMKVNLNALRQDTCVE